MIPSAQSVQIILPIISIVLLLLSFKRSVYGAIGYFIILNGKLGEMYPLLGVIRFELIAAAIALINVAIQQKGLQQIFPGSKTSKINSSTYLLFLVGMLSVIQAINVEVAWNLGGYFLLKNILFYMMVVGSIHDNEDVYKIIWAFILIALWIAYEPVTNFLNGISQEHAYGAVATGRFGVAIGHVALANTLNQAIPLTVYWAIANRERFVRFILWAFLAIIVCGVIFTKSRGGFVGLMAILLGIIYLSENKAKAIFVSGILCLLILLYAGEDYISHMGTISDGIHGSRSTSDRWLGLVNGISMMIKRPIMGVGIGCYATARSIYFNYYFYAHNLYGELFGELGLSSVFWFYWIYTILKTARCLKIKAVEKDKNSFFYILCGVQIGLFFRLIIGNFSHCALIWFWFLMAAIVAGIDNVMSQSK